MRELGLGEAAKGLPAHLEGIPECLHKYGPLIEQQLAAEQIDAPPVQLPAA